MIELPDFDRPWMYENGFYLTADPSRFSKFIAHYELFRRSLDLSGAVLEFGVFKGASLMRLLAFRELLSTDVARQVVAFDTFGVFPETEFEPGIEYREEFVEKAGEESISFEQLEGILEKRGYENVELVEGDIIRTLPEYLEDNPELRISFLNLDTDIYEPSKVILEECFDRVVPGGVVLLDDYGVFPGETEAVDEFFSENPHEIKKFPFAQTPSYVIKE